MNLTIEDFFNNHQITQEEHDILFVDKSDWYIRDEDYYPRLKKDKVSHKELFELSLIKVINLHSQYKEIPLYDIHFPSFDISFYSNTNILDKKLTFINCVFYENTSFKSSTIKNDIYIESCTFFSQVIFYDCSFNGDFHMAECNFLDCVNFIYASFNGKAYFANLVFIDDVDFTECNFYKESTIWLSIFCKSLILDGATFHLNSIISEINFFEINLNNMKSLQLGLLKLSGIKNSSLINKYFKKIILQKQSINQIDTFFEENSLFIPLNKNNFRNKESIRLIKNYFEKQNNIIEANKYFPIEQEFYICDLSNNTPTDPNKYKNLFVLYLNKYISYFGTDWIRPLLVMFIFGFFASYFYIVFSNTPTILKSSKDILLWTSGGFILSIIVYLFYHYKEWKLLSISIISYICLLYFSEDLRLITNDISKLVNPLNIFKGKDYFEDIAPYGMMVKLIMATLIYQFIIAFRQNTRRK